MFKILVYLIAVFIFVDCQTCPVGYSYVYDRCITAARTSATQWKGSDFFCTPQVKVIIDSCAFYGDLVRYLHFNDLESDVGYWIGASYSDEEDEWLWQDKTPVSIGAPFWGSTGSTWTPEPSNGTNENCVMLVRGDRYRFHNEDCANLAYVLCQTAKIDDSIDFKDPDSKCNIKDAKKFVSDISCPDGYELIGNSCFYFHFNASDVGTRTPWNEASQICQETYEGSHLAILDTCDLFTEVVDFINNNSQYDLPETRAYWIGGTDQGEEGHWYWINSNAMGMGVPLWGTLGDGTPEPSGGESQNCATMYRDDSYYFHDSECDKNAYPLCQLDPIQSA